MRRFTTFFSLIGLAISMAIVAGAQQAVTTPGSTVLVGFHEDALTSSPKQFIKEMPAGLSMFYHDAADPAPIRTITEMTENGISPEIILTHRAGKDAVKDFNANGKTRTNIADFGKALQAVAWKEMVNVIVVQQINDPSAFNSICDDNGVSVYREGVQKFLCEATKLIVGDNKQIRCLLSLTVGKQNVIPAKYFIVDGVAQGLYPVGYNFGTEHSWSKNVTVDELFGSAIKLLQQLAPKMPIILQAACSSSIGEEKKAQFIDELLIFAKTNHVEGIILIGQDVGSAKWGITGETRKKLAAAAKAARETKNETKTATAP